MIKKESSILSFLQGFVIGLGVIFPISASVLAIAMGIYKKLLNIIKSPFKCLKNEPKFMLSFVLGVVISLIVSSLSLDYLMNNLPIATLLFFIGLVCGGIPSIYEKIDKDIKLSNILLSLIGISIILFISFITKGKDVNILLNAKSLLKLFMIGVIGSGSMIIPGVSGSVMLIIFGYYEPILGIISSFFKGIDIFNNFIFLSVFSLGMLLGLVIFAKGVSFLLEKYEIKSYFIIMGFIIASIIKVFLSLFSYSFSILQVLIGIVFFVVSFFISFKYLKE